VAQRLHNKEKEIVCVTFPKRKFLHSRLCVIFKIFLKKKFGTKTGVHNTNGSRYARATLNKTKVVV
jgi:hypothetical protein